MGNQGKRRYPTLDVVKMYSTLTMEHWKTYLINCGKKGLIDKLIKTRYGLQAGLADAVSKGLSNEKMEMWVIKRCRDLEQCMKYIVKRKHPMPGDQVVSKTHKGKRLDYAMDAIEAKRARDRELEDFFMRSNF